MHPPQQNASAALFGGDARVRDIARGLYERVAGAAIISPHGHVPARLLADDEAFADPAELLITHDHYVTRLLHADGVALDDLGIARRGEPSTADPREVWRIVAERWHLFAGTASAFWLENELSGVLGIETEISAESADSIYDRISAKLQTPEFRPRALFATFGIDVLATTDDPLDDLRFHTRLAAERRAGAGLSGRVIPTFRPDAHLDPAQPGFTRRVEALLESNSAPSTTFAAYLDALRARRRYFVEHGAVSADHGVVSPTTADLEPAEAEALFQRVLGGGASAADAHLFGSHMLLQMAGMSVEDGLVMTVHAGVSRNHSRATFDRHGPDTGHDIPVPTSFTAGLRPLLERFGLEPNLNLVLFTVDETAYSREIAPLAGFYPTVYIGAPWWFLDAPDAMQRFRSAVTETAGFYRSSGFVDDTRAFLSIPARHETARRADASFLARLVSERRISLSTAEKIADDLVDAIPRRAFKL